MTENNNNITASVTNELTFIQIHSKRAQFSCGKFSLGLFRLFFFRKHKLGNGQRWNGMSQKWSSQWRDGKTAAIRIHFFSVIIIKFNEILNIYALASDFLDWKTIWNKFSLSLPPIVGSYFYFSISSSWFDAGAWQFVLAKTVIGSVFFSVFRLFTESEITILSAWEPVTKGALSTIAATISGYDYIANLNGEWTVTFDK